MRAAFAKLPQSRLSDTTTYAELPNGTRIMSMTNSSIRLALPVRLSPKFDGSGTGRFASNLRKVKLFREAPGEKS
ncbi:MAG: hypothetical protein OXU81_17445 [Gammaproteobacteria bacterium]|nr:hypothetical protein [Gammaproteobacteria bacterium]